MEASDRPSPCGTSREVRGERGEAWSLCPISQSFPKACSTSEGVPVDTRPWKTEKQTSQRRGGARQAAGLDATRRATHQVQCLEPRPAYHGPSRGRAGVTPT